MVTFKNNCNMDFFVLFFYFYMSFMLSLFSFVLLINAVHFLCVCVSKISILVFYHKIAVLVYYLDMNVN